MEGCRLKIVVVSPHRDDACFSLGLSVGAWIEAGQTVAVVNCFTRSEYAPYAEFEFIHSNDRMARVSALRLREDEAWQKMYARGLQLVDLNLKDAPLRLHIAVDQVLGWPVNPDDKTMSKLPRAVAALRPDAVVLPLALGGHVDHVTARSAMLIGDEIGAGLAGQMPMAFYEDLPYAARPGAAGEIEGVAQGLGADLGRELEPVFVTEEGLVDEAVERKRRLALCYDSQIADEVAQQIAAFSVGYGGRERLWGNAAWRAADWLRGEVRR